MGRNAEKLSEGPESQPNDFGCKPFRKKDVSD